ncbi:hypothetical protein N7466_005991 [Penicillium verhagenii]|uniref:uncharacterized protein n=1 Tax=Penicillium verhagenii TaxID=1562060 RepID=UPI00254505A6|nr:uncharacterized protein N7466_005991 [Penicillium verhagenii]KAJ5930498.1 hypothetical protein N7466_005991 [Penicillium verhagenii]
MQSDHPRDEILKMKADMQEERQSLIDIWNIQEPEDSAKQKRHISPSLMPSEVDDNDIFWTCLAEIDAVMDKTSEEPPECEKQELLAQLPREYQDYWDVFLKRNSDTLPEIRGRSDFRIELTEEFRPVM